MIINFEKKFNRNKMKNYKQIEANTKHVSYKTDETIFKKERKGKKGTKSIQNIKTNRFKSDQKPYFSLKFMVNDPIHEIYFINYVISPFITNSNLFPHVDTTKIRISVNKSLWSMIQ